MLVDLRAYLRDSVPLRLLIARWLDRHLRRFSYQSSLERGSSDYVWYGHPLLLSASLARKMGHGRISAIGVQRSWRQQVGLLEHHA